MLKAKVNDYLEQARECVALANEETGFDRKRLIRAATIWLRLAGEAMDEAFKSHSINGRYQESA